MATGNGNGNGQQTKDEIMTLLKGRPVGLTIRGISQSLDIHRQTISKYVLVLEAEGLIYRRNIGSATIHYPKQVYDSRMTDKKRSKRKV